MITMTTSPPKGAMHKYSDYFKTIHDETQPSHLVMGAHLSVLRAVVGSNFLDFGVIWDRDHDKRVIGALERMYIKGLLEPVAFVGERKGILTVLVYRSHDYWKSHSASKYCNTIAALANGLPGDAWGSDVDYFRSVVDSPIGNTGGWDDDFLVVMHKMWRLGFRDAIQSMDAEYAKYEIQHENNLIALMSE